MSLSGEVVATVCFFNTTPFWGGGEKWHLEAASGLRARGHRVVVLGYPGAPLVTRARARELDTAEFEVHNRSWLNPWMLRRLRRFFVDREVDTVLFNGPADLKAGGLAARWAGVPRRVYRRGLALPVRAHRLNRYLFERVLTHVVTNSEETRVRLFEHLGPVLASERVAVIPNGIDLDAFDGGAVRSVVPRDGGGVLIGTVGRLTRQKNHAALLEAARLLVDQGVQFRLLVAGSGELEEELRDHARRLGLEGRVDFLGFVEDVPGFMKRIDLFVLPSTWEGFGYVIVEAGAACRPTVAFDLSSNPEVVVDGTTGFLVEPGNVRQFADRVRTLVEDRALRVRMGEAAREDVASRFTQEHALDRIEAFLGLGATAAAAR